MKWLDKLLSKLSSDKNVTDASKSSITSKNSIPVIDCSKECNQAQKELLSKWQELILYKEFLSLKDDDKEPILKFIYNNFGYHCSSVAKNLAQQYPYYDKDFLHFIAWKEGRRLLTKVKKIKALNEGFVWYKISTHSKTAELKDSICLIQDVENIDNCWLNSKGYYEHYSFLEITDIKKDNNIIKLYYQNKLHKLTIKEFEEFCEKEKLMFPNIQNYFLHARKIKIQQKGGTYNEQENEESIKKLFSFLKYNP